MSDTKDSVLPDIIEPMSNAIQQNIPETAKQADGALSTVVGFFNNVVLYPVKKANLTFRYKLETFEDDLKEKIKHIPPENLQVPPTMIAGPALEALRYTYDEAELREMYENLATAELELVNLLKGSADIKNYEMNQIIMDYETEKLLEDKNDFLKNSL